jgi:hypothetical protein
MSNQPDDGFLNAAFLSDRAPGDRSPVDGFPGPLPSRSELRPRRRRPGRIVGGALAAVAALAALLVWAPWDTERGQAIADGLVVWLEPAPTEIRQLADSTGMSEAGRLIFFASTPELDTAEAFNVHCPVDEQIVLGCYSNREIYLFRVTDERLAGTNEVTAAHEMLHAAYHRLPQGERERIGALITAYVATLPQDHPLFAILETYDADDHADELHARLGTEFAELTPELEAHYARYFDDRALVVAHYETANAALNANSARIAQLTAQLDALGADIDTRRRTWDAESLALDADIQRYNAAGWTPTSDREYDELNARSDAREAQRVAISRDIDRYNALVEELNRLSADSALLYDHLDSMAGARQPAP